MIIKKDFKFDCCHMLSNYFGKCANLHGHTYHGSITIDADVNEETRMVLDYNEVKLTVDRFDHALILSSDEHSSEAEKKLYEWAWAYNMKIFEMPYNTKTTAEDIAKVLLEAIKAKLETKAKIEVVLSETDGSYAIARGEANG